MYLPVLNEKQKELFLDLAYNLASIDGDYSDEEKQMMEAYCIEMQLEYRQEMEKQSVDRIINAMKKECGELEKKIVIFEAIGLAMADNIYDESERKIVKMMVDVFEMQEGFGEECESALREYFSLQEKLNKLIIA